MRIIRLDQVDQFAAVQVLSDPGYIPGPKIIPNAAQVVLRWQLTGGNIAHNVLYATYDGDPALSVALAQTIFAAASTGAAWTAMAAHLAPTASFAGVNLLDVRSTSGAILSSTGAAVPGTSTGTALPDEVAIAVSLSTQQRGPSGRGRIYLPGWATTALGTGNVVTPAVITAVNNWIGHLFNTAIAPNLGAVVLGRPARAAYTSPITGRVFPARPADTLTLSGAGTRDNHWDSQRRRGLK